MSRTLARCALVTARVALGATAGAAPARAGHGAPVTAPTVQAEQIARLLGNRQPVVLIDLRPEEGFRQGHLPGARSMPFAQLRRRYGEIPSAGAVVLYGTGTTSRCGSPS